MQALMVTLLAIPQGGTFSDGTRFMDAFRAGECVLAANISYHRYGERIKMGNSVDSPICTVHHNVPSYTPSEIAQFSPVRAQVEEWGGAWVRLQVTIQP